MSYATFLASDMAMPDMENPYQQYLSVSGAMAEGAAIPIIVLGATAIDRDIPGVLLWIDYEDNLGG